MLNSTVNVRYHVHATFIAASLLFGVAAAGAQPAASGTLTATSPTFRSGWTRLEHVDHALARSELQIRNSWQPVWRAPDADHVHRRWPLRADPRRWPRLFANTTECTLSFDPVLRRHWWQ
jgi:hypothetical protein